jgi:hypothetical protein
MFQYQIRLTSIPVTAGPMSASKFEYWYSGIAHTTFANLNKSQRHMVRGRGGNCGTERSRVHRQCGYRERLMKNLLRIAELILAGPWRISFIYESSRLASMHVLKVNASMLEEFKL